MNTREVKYFAQSFTTSSDELEIKYLSLLLLSLSSQVLLDLCCFFSGSPHPWRLGKLPQIFFFSGQIMERKHLYYLFCGLETWVSNVQQAPECPWDTVLCIS